MSDKFVKASLATVAALSASSVAHDAAFAADAKTVASANNNPLTITVVGGVVLSDFSQDNVFSNYSSYKLGIETDKDIGGFGSISIGRAFETNSPFDWRISGSITEFMANDRNEAISYYGYGYNEGLKDDSDWQHVDVEIGHTTKSGNAELRLGLGARMTHLTRSTSFAAGVSAYALELNERVDDKEEFFGGGPRASIEGRLGGTFALEFAASVSALFGDQKSSFGYGVGYSYFNYDLPAFGVSATENDWRWLTDVDASVGVNFKPSDSFSLSAGYRYEQISNMDTIIINNDISVSGPYVKLTSKF